MVTRQGWKRVNKVWESGRGREVWEIQAGGNKVSLTPDHLVWVEGKGFTRVDALSYGDILLVNSSGDLTPLPVEAIGVGKRIADKVYDIEVDGMPEYTAGGILVHNCRYALDAHISTKGRMPVFKRSDLSRI